jgi:CcmD family protein
MKSWKQLFVAAGLLVLLWTAVSLAQTPTVDEFVPLAPGELLADQEQIPAPRLVFAAYAVVWLTFAFYLLSLWRRVTQVEGELRTLSSKLEKPGR